METLGPHPRPAELETLGVVPNHLHANKPLGVAHSHSKAETTALEKCNHISKKEEKTLIF